MAWEKSMFVGCNHGDFVDEDAVKVAKRFMADWNPKHRNHLGDNWDFRAIRKGASPEEKAEGMRRDIECGFEFLEWFKPQQFVYGNHDHRPYRMAQESSNATTAELFEDLCNDMDERLRKMKIKVTPWGVEEFARFPIGNIKLIHGFRSSKTNPAKINFDEYGQSIASHVHKPSTYHACHIDRTKAYTVGTMANISKMGYANGFTSKLGWRNGFMYGIHNTKTGDWEAWHVVKQDDGSWLSPHGIL